jgi:seryl-tRNA synthetase
LTPSQHLLRATNSADADEDRQVASPFVIDQRLLRNDLDAVKASLSRRGRPALLDDVDAAARLDERLLDIGRERDDIRAAVNAISKDVGALRRDGNVAEAEARQAESRDLGTQEKSLAAEHDAVALELRDLLLGIPNMPHPNAPDGETDADNPVVIGPINLLDDYPAHQRVPHWESAEELGILDNERAVKISGAMFTMQRGAGATLARALCQYGLDLNADAHEEVRPPSLVSTATLTATGQLPKFAEDAYAIERDDLWASPTAEAPLTSIYAGETLDDTQLPIRLMAQSSSYRREAGSAGRDTRGMLRAHEFDKVEMMAYSTPEGAPDLLDDMVARVERAIAGLKLPYRVIEICTGDMGQSHHRTYDVEVYAPGVDAWLEVSSVSWLGDYQARRANIRFRRHDDDGKPVKGTEFAHTLNGSALAVPRVWAAIVENYRNEDGSITVPDVLRPYMRGIDVIRKSP